MAPTPVLLPGEAYGQRSLGGYSLWGCKELDTTERLTPSHASKPKQEHLYDCLVPKNMFFWWILMKSSSMYR